MNLDSEVAAIRQASRQMVRELGILGSIFHQTGLSNSQCHVLVEIDLRGEMSPGHLAETLRLDPSTITRIIQPMAVKGWIVVERNEFDGRSQVLRLSPEGRDRVRRIHEISNAQAREALKRLHEEDRLKVVVGIQLYARALEKARLRRGIEISLIQPSDDAPLARLIRETMEEFGVLGPGTAHADVEVDAMSTVYSAPRHAYYVVRRGKKVLGGAGIGPLVGGSRETCELRKMYLKPEVRGLGVGTELLQTCMAAARSLLYRRCYLETMSHMEQARALYERAGFHACSAPQGQTGHYTCDAWYMREL